MEVVELLSCSMLVLILRLLPGNYQLQFLALSHNSIQRILKSHKFHSYEMHLVRELNGE